jgi:16S rRNA (uracil1498-N3)-methyltransferase
MRIPRIYTANNLGPNRKITLNIQASKHILHVLRLKLGGPLILFNGAGGEYNAELYAIDKQKAIIQVQQFIDKKVESPLKIHLAQGISRGEKMDYTIQKAVELGIYKITPLFTERCNVKLSGERLQKRLQHWQAIAISACEQSGRTYIPNVEYAKDLATWLTQDHQGLCLTLYHKATQSIANLKTSSSITLLIGPEGGLSDYEINLASQHNFTPIRFGPRILRTETAALTAISILQSKWGDLL